MKWLIKKIWHLDDRKVLRIEKGLKYSNFVMSKIDGQSVQHNSKTFVIQFTYNDEFHFVI